MAWTTQEFATILQDALIDWRNRVDGADTSSDTEVYHLFAVVAGMVWMLEYALQYDAQQIFPDTADAQHLERWATVYGLERKAARQADDGSFLLGGTPGTAVSAGLSIALATGLTYTTTEAGTISALGILAVAATCDEAGTTGNHITGEQGTIDSPPSGVDATATIVVDFTTGAEQETDAQLLSRLLTRIRAGSAGGTALDYEQWALTIDGISFAYALPLRRGPGTVDVAVFQADEDGHRTPAGVALRTEVADYIDTVRPVTVDVAVPTVTETTVDVTVEITVFEDGYDLDDVEAAIETAITDEIYELGPGDTLYVKALIRAIGSVDGVADFTLSEPAANVASTVDEDGVEILIPGTLTVSAS